MKDLLVFVCFVALVGGTTDAQTERGRRGREGQSSRWEFYSEKYDANKDSKITRAEYTRNDATFGRLDSNNDNVLTEADFSGSGRRNRGRGGRRMAGMRGMMFKRVLSRSADADENGAIDAKEWTSFKKTVDSDKNNVISEEELTKVGTPERMARMMVRRLDLDEDGKTSLDDFNALFARLDADKSGVLEKGELKVESRRRRGGRRGQDSSEAAKGPTLGKGVPKPGEKAPDFKLPVLGKKQSTAQLSSFSGKKPVALIFGSYT